MPRIPIAIPTLPYLADHHFMGQPVLPAVEAMEILAAAVRQVATDASVTTIHQARFEKFLPMDMSVPEIEAFIDVEPMNTGGWQAALLTKTTSAKAAITRTKVHAQLCFGQQNATVPSIPLDVAAVPEGICVKVSPDKVYQELVPFGATYANIKTPVWLSSDGALAAIECPDMASPAGSHHLGSPFALDAAFHAACVWGQHFYPVVAFPVALDQRHIIKPIRPERTYFARVIPKQTTPDLLVFDLWLLSHEGDVCEVVLGVQMQDVSRGRFRPPEWITRKRQPDPWATLRSNNRPLAVLELDAVAPYASKALSPIETERMENMGSRRKRSYLGARMALKRLSRALGGDDQHADPQSLCTLDDDRVRPRCPVADGMPHIHCSAAHDGRFAIAVAAEHPVGVDVETISLKTITCAGIYMTEREEDLMRSSGLGKANAATRIWSLKEAVAKATGIDLATTWQRIETQSIKEHQSTFTIDNNGAFTARHVQVDTHLFTVVKLDHA